MKMINGSNKQDRLAEALRANLRRRKISKIEPAKQDNRLPSPPTETSNTK